MTDDDIEPLEDETGPGGDDTESEARERIPKTVPVGMFVLAVLVAGILGVLAVVALADTGGDGDDSTQHGARAAAGEYAERFLALSFDDYDGWLEDMRSIGTAGFAESVDRRNGELRTLLSQAQVSWQGTAVDVFVSDAGDGIVSAVVLYDLQVTDADGTRTIPDQYLRLDLVEGSGGWLVERVLSITSDASAVIAGAEQPPPTTAGVTTTTVGG